MSARENIMRRVRDALAPLPERAALPDWDQTLVHKRQPATTTDHWAEFSRQLQAVNATPLNQLTELITLLQENDWRHGYCDPELWPQVADAFPDGFEVETTFDRTRIDDYQFGITRATGAIAETGTLILSDEVTSSRLAALTPWVHVAIVDPETIHPDILSALANPPQDPNMIWVTGPSKTADVEGILIEGVHGPGRQIALRWEG